MSHDAYAHHLQKLSSRTVHAVGAQIAGTHQSVEAGVRVRRGLGAEAVEQACVLGLALESSV